MSPTETKPEKSLGRYALNLTLAAVAGQVGCLTLLIVLAALFGGLWLDSRLGTRPMFTIGLMIASVPVTMAVMFWVVRMATARIRSDAKPESKSDEGEN